MGNVFKGDSLAVAQVNHETPANVGIADEFYLRLDDKEGKSHEISFTSGDELVKSVVEGLVAAGVAAATAAIAPWNAVTCTEDDEKVIITADVAGAPFWVVTRTVDGDASDDQTLSDSASVACSGPSIFNDKENWSLDAAPTADGDLEIPQSATSSINGEDESDYALDTLKVKEGCTVNIGSEDRPLILDVDEDVELGGTGLIYLSLENTNSVVVKRAGKGGGVGGYSLNLEGGADGTNTALDILAEPDDRVGVASLPGKAAVFTTIRISSGTVHIGSGVTCTTIEVLGGTVTIDCSHANLTVRGGTVVHNGGVSTALVVEGGKVFYNNVIACPTVTIMGTGVVSCENDLRGRTFTQTDLYSGASLLDPHSTITHTNGIDLIRCGFEDVTIKRGSHFVITYSGV